MYAIKKLTNRDFFDSIRENYKGDNMPEIIKKYSNGKVCERYNVDENGREQGFYEHFYEDGTLAQKYYLKDGVKNGHYESFDGDCIFESGTYKNGLLDGKYQIFDSQMRLLKEIPYKKGQMNGMATAYFMIKDQTLFYECEYKNGVKDGVFKEYSYEGKLKMKGTYAKGKKDGEFISYDDEGKVSKINYYMDDQCVYERLSIEKLALDLEKVCEFLKFLKDQSTNPFRVGIKNSPYSRGAFAEQKTR